MKVMCLSRGITMLRAAMHKLSTSIKAICKVIENCSLAGSFRYAETFSAPGPAPDPDKWMFSCCEHLME